MVDGSSRARSGADVQSTQRVVNLVPETTEDEFNTAVASAKKAFVTWSKTSVIRRQRIVFE